MKRIAYFFILCILTLGSILPLFKQGFFSMHDDTQVARVIVMSRALHEWQFPVRWVKDLGYGYGYPIFNFYGPLPYYFASAFVLLGMPPFIATKIMFVFGVVTLFFSTYILVSVFWGSWAGIISGAMALYAPYHAVQIYVRGAVGEFWASAFLPFVIFGLMLASNKKTQARGILIGALSVAAVILSHTISGYIVVGAILMFISVYSGLVIYKKMQLKKSYVWSYILLLLLGLGISFFFWFPAILEMKYTNVSGQIGVTANFRDHFVCLSQLWSSQWGYGGSVPGCIDGLSFKLGRVHIIVSILGLILFFRNKKLLQQSLVYVGITILCMGLWFIFPVSMWIWERIPGFAYIQYPWRFLSIIVLGISILGGMVGVYGRKGILFRIGNIICILVIIGVNMKLFTPQYITNVTDQEYESVYELRYRASKVSDEYLPPGFVRPISSKSIVFDTIIANVASGSGSALKIKDTAIDAVFRVSSSQATTIRIQRAYFPGWRYFVNQKEVKPAIVNGIPEISIERGDSIVEAKLFDTPIRIFANVVSLITCIGLIYFYAKYAKIIT